MARAIVFSLLRQTGQPRLPCSNRPEYERRNYPTRRARNAQPSGGSLTRVLWGTRITTKPPGSKSERLGITG
jgi:hypothetical protein